MKKLIALLLAMLMVMGMVACGAQEEVTADETTEEVVEETTEETTEEVTEETVEAEATDMEYVVEKGTLVVGITDFAPMDYKDENGEWIGFDADMAKAFAESLGVACEFVEIDWDSKILELDGKTIDAVWNGMTLTNEVMNAMETSVPYSKNAQVVVVNAEAAEQYSTVEACMDLAFAVEAGSAGEAAALENGFNATPVESQAAALMEVASGTSDACIIDLLMASAMIGEGTSYENMVYTLELNSEEYGVGFRKDSDLATALNAFFGVAYEDGSMMECAETYGIAGSVEAAMAG